MFTVVGSKLVAKHDFRAEGQGELSVRAGDLLALVQPETAASAGWLLLRKEDLGETGYVPKDFVQEYRVERRPSARMSMAVPPAFDLQWQQQDLPQSSSSTSAGGDYLKTAWARRDELFNAGLVNARTPLPAERRWFYRDIFGDLQGPFNEEEMAQRVEARHIQPDTYCAAEVGTPSQFEERKLKELFPHSPATAFSSPHVMARLTPNPKTGMKFWYFEARDGGREFGPFSTDQMRFWFDVEGYFGSMSRVREASSDELLPLKHVFADPMLCFLSPQTAAAAAPQQQQPRSPMQQYKQTAMDPFGERRSSRALLQHALDSSSSHQSGAQEFDETLALFDKIELETSMHPTQQEQQEGGGSNNATPAPKLLVYGDASYEWPVWRGVPQPLPGSTAFPTVLYSFVTRPLNPNAGRILANVTREVEGVLALNYNKFTLWLENENGEKQTLVAHRHTSISGSSTFDIKLVANERTAPLLIAKMDVNFMGTQFTLHNDVPGHVGVPKDLCCILYEATRMGNGGPRKMKVAVPDLDDKGEYKVFKRTGGTNQLISALQALNPQQRCISMLNKPPKWNPARGAYSLDFGGRVKRASVKNFQLVDAFRDPDHARVLLQHGRVSDDKFSCDVSHPLSLLQAFAVCLSSLHQKKAVD